MTEIVKIECPFCHKKTVLTILIPPMIQASTSRVSAKSVTKFYKTKEKYEVQSDCSNCGKSAKEIQKALDEGKRDPEREKKILERLKKQRLFTGEIKTKF